MDKEILFTANCDMTVTLAVSVILLLLGTVIKKMFPILKRFFIPVPVLGGIFFAILALIGYKAGLFYLTFDSSLKDLLMMAFFTSIGFTASFRMLVHGGISVVIFLLCSMLLICLQNIVGVGLAELFGLNPLMGLATGSIPLTGGHGTSAAFGPLLEQHGLTGALSVSVAGATFGLVMGSMLGGPVGKLLMARNHISPVPKAEAVQVKAAPGGEIPKAGRHDLYNACACLIVCMGIGTFINMWLKHVGIVLPSYLAPMIVAAVMRNVADLRRMNLPTNEISTLGELALQYFLAMALMSMRLWELESLAVPLVVILLVQTVLLGFYAYFVTFNMMGRDYDAAVLACGHCGFGMGATPNAIANMDTFTGANGPSPKAFFVVPIVGSLFIDFVNAIVITIFIKAIV